MKVRLFKAFSSTSRTGPINPRISKSSCQRALTTSASPSQQPIPPADSEQSPATAKWLSHTKARIGKCIMFGMSDTQAQEAGKVLKILAKEWRELTAGREGFLTDQKRAGLLRQPVVWGEMDSMGHINNVMYTRFAESGRMNWALNFARYIDPEHEREWSELGTSKGDGWILKSIKTDFKFPMTWPDRISVFHKLRHSPSNNIPDKTSFLLDVLILSEVHQRPAARCVEDIVVYDYAAGKKVAVRGFMSAGFRKFWKEQKIQKRRVEKRIKELDAMVRKLEEETWDKDDAVEDLGEKAASA